MALSDGLGIQALVQSYDKNAVSKAFTEIASQLNKSVDELNDDLNKIKIDKDVVNNLVNQLRALPEEVRKKTQGMSFDLFSDLINANGAEEKIDEAFKLFSNKMQSFVKLRDQIGNDEIIIKADYSQIDELIGKTEKLLELQKELDKWQKEASPRTKVSIEGDISNLESEIKSGIANLNVSGEQVGVGVNVDNEALTELDKKIKEIEESLKSAREEAEKYGGSLDVLKKKIDQTYNKSVDKDTQKNADNFREAVQNYIKAGGSQKDLDKDYLSWYKLLGESWPKNFIPLNQITNESEKAQEKVKELESVLDDLYKQRDELIKGTGSRTGDGVGFEASKEEAEDLLSVIKEIRDVLNQFKENKSLLNSEEINTLKQRISELDTQISDIQTKLQNIGKDSFDGTVNDANELLNKLENVYDQITFVQDKLQGLDDNVFSGMKTDIDNLVNKFDVMNEQLQEFINLSSKADVPEMKTQNEVNDKDNINSNFDNSDAIKGQNKLQLELDETKGKIQEVGTEAQEAKQKIEDLGRIDVNPEVNPKETSAPSHTLEKDISQTDSSSIISEQQALNNLEQAIKSVTIAIVEKNKAIQAEEVQMDLSIDQEIKKLEELKGKLEEIKTEFQNGIANGLFKYNENQNGNEQGDKELNVSKIPVEPLLIQSEWEAEIDKILKAIGTKKIKIEPDISSKAWNSFKTFVDNISKQVINLKVVDKGSYGLPSDLKASYTNSTKYVTDLYKVEEKIAQAKESGNQKDLERLATLEAEKKKYEDLLRLEEQFRANEKFKDFDTTSQDNALNKLKSTKEQEYQSNRQVAAIRIEEEAYNENQKFDQNKKLEKASSLLEQQKAKWEEIQNIRIKISNLDPVNDADEINNLNAQKSSLESELSMIEKELTLYDSLIDKKKQSNELDKIAANADKQVNDNTLDRVNKLYNDYVNNINEQAQLELKGGNRTDEEEQRLVQLRQEYLDLIERINKALTEEQNKTSAISKVLESMKIAKDLGVSGVLRNNDVDQGYEEANKVNNALNEAKKKMEDLEKLGKTDLFKQAFSDANNEIKNLNQQLISGEITLTEYNKKVKEITTSLSKKTNAVAFFDPGDMEKTAQQMKDLAQQLPGLREDTIKWGAGNKQLTAIFQDQNGEWKKLTLNAQTAGKVITATFTNAKKPATTFSKFIDELGAKFRNLGSYLLSFVGFYEIWGQIKQGVTYVKELDTALTEMRKVSDETVESLREFQEVSFATADAIGTTAKEIQNSTADFMRLGYTLQEAGELAEDANIYANVGDMDIDEATEHMISSIKAWGSEFESEVEASEAIIDRYNEIGM